MRVKKDNYANRHGKTYRHKWVNAHQTPAERRGKYAFAKALTGNSKFAGKMRDRRKDVMARDVANYVNFRGGTKRG